jgi:L-glyceraldehyde 3-phosphate reductase
MFNRFLEQGLQTVLTDEDIGTIAFCPLAEGVLTDKYLKGIPSDSRAASASIFLNARDITEEKLFKIRRLNDLAINRGQSLAQMALAWVLRGGLVTSALIGASKVSQVEDSVAALNNLDFSESELQEIENILK